jgi:hypothetical protein
MNLDPSKWDWLQQLTLLLFILFVLARLGTLASRASPHVGAVAEVLGLLFWITAGALFLRWLFRLAVRRFQQ